ncbi:Carbonic anhydrase, chloroplastic [Dichanthelium oligosanthes]|uniref:Carbonic anhydrase n=1 Tax=Dichanthelium oligosanthes TaxID=888268 RepID=A0A1E5UUL4_9POAL|nr:Carbonic anhydrase, chloroplastic [Dichanthelium oligosanthes]
MPRPPALCCFPLLTPVADGCCVQGLGAAERLKAGFRTFKRTIYDQNPMLFGPLKSAQSPKYMVFACSDSRVCPSVTLDLKPGEAFTVRNIASLVPAYHQNMHSSVASAIEFAVTILKVECIVVIGHSCCGGIRELLSLKEDSPHTYHFIDNWVKIGLAIKKKVEHEHALLSFEDQCTMLEIVSLLKKWFSVPHLLIYFSLLTAVTEISHTLAASCSPIRLDTDVAFFAFLNVVKEAVNLSLRNLKTYPFVKDKLTKGTLKLIGARYDFVHGSFNTWHA